MVRTAGCEPRLRAYDPAAGGKVLTVASWRHIKITTLIVLIGLELRMILGSGWPWSLFFLLLPELHGARTQHTCSRIVSLAKETWRTETPSVT